MVNGRYRCAVNFSQDATFRQAILYKVGSTAASLIQFTCCAEHNHYTPANKGLNALYTSVLCNVFTLEAIKVMEEKKKKKCRRFVWEPPQLRYGYFYSLLILVSGRGRGKCLTTVLNHLQTIFYRSFR